MYTERNPIFKVRDGLPPDDLSTWELAKLLVDNGWTWRLMPRDLKAREALPPQAATDGPGIWYTLGETLIRPYLLCLHKSHDLHAEFAIEDIPHYFRDAPVKRYQAILAGKPLPPAESKRKRQRAIVDLQPEFQSDEEPLALQDEAAEEPDDDNGVYGLLADEEDVDIIKMLEDAIEEEELLRQMIEQQEVQEPEPENDDVDLVEEGAEDDESEQDAEEPEPDAPAPAEGITSFGRLRQIPWGAFVIARKRVDGQEKSLECRCLYHKKNQTTGCKKTISYTADNEGHALAVARWWCNQARDVHTQNDHLKLFEDIMEIPYYPYDVLLQGQIATLEGEVKTDVQIQKEEREAQKRARGRGRGRGRGDQGRGRKGRGRARGRGGGQVEAEDSSSFSSSSSSD